MNYESSAAARAEIPSKGERLKKILDTLNESEPAQNAQAAYNLVEESFHSTESGLDPADRMGVLPFEGMDSLTDGDQEVLYSIYNSHVLFLGKNGAIDIRGIDKNFPVTKKLLDKNPKFPYEHMKSFFSKPGADGLEIWN